MKRIFALLLLAAALVAADNPPPQCGPPDCAMLDR